MDAQTRAGFQRELDGLRRYRRQQNLLTFLYFFAAVGLTCVGKFLEIRGFPSRAIFPFFISAFVLWTATLFAYSRFKGRSGAWCLASFASIFALLLMVVLRDDHAQRMLLIEGALAVSPEPDTT